MLLSTYNGAAYLREQLDSILGQTYSNIHVLVRDDGSSDSTSEILKYYIATFDNIIVCDWGHNIGSSASFYRLLEFSTANYVMFCDQDDFWLPGKVQSTLSLADETFLTGVPGLVFTDLTICDGHLNIVSESMHRVQKNDVNYIVRSYLAMLAQNTVAGCTMLINRSSVNFILDRGLPPVGIVHDHWFAVNIARNGVVAYLDESTILYRQHDSNQVGSKSVGVRYIFSRLLSVKHILQHDARFVSSLGGIGLVDIFKLIVFKLYLNCTRIF